MTRPLPALRVAIIGAGPAGIYAGSILARLVRESGGTADIDLFDALPAPYGLIRYGVAPDHPRIKGIVTSLHEMLDSGTVRFVGNVRYGVDVGLAELREHYHAVVFATGAIRDAELDVPGIGLAGSHGAAEFVSWFYGHPGVPRDWALKTREKAVAGNRNVALDWHGSSPSTPRICWAPTFPGNAPAGPGPLPGEPHCHLLAARPGRRQIPPQSVVPIPPGSRCGTLSSTWKNSSFKEERPWALNPRSKGV